ncbi:hypothetical protein FOL47_008309 [Perkinsus chesapeaki]|uniref:Uncharacterized protein n=1 Tax=Perkinsus chesapeaki TaxID=330153 RepID=A0A7J6LEW5_PERCH|nr:hypothetical protein FOL47_008309 [Perkinsus chesapeaki]
MVAAPAHRSLSRAQLEQCRLAFEFLDEQRKGVLEVDTGLGHFWRLAGFCPTDEQVQILIEKLKNDKVELIDFHRAVDITRKELLPFACDSVTLLNSTQEAIKLLGRSNTGFPGPPSEKISIANLRARMVSSTDQRSINNFERMIQEMGYKGDEEVDPENLAEMLLNPTITE